MPLTPDEQAVADRLARLFADTEASILAQVADAATSDQAKSRLRALLAEVESVFKRLIDGARSWLSTDLPALHAAGATEAAARIGQAFTWTQVHVDAVEALARSTWGDVAEKLQHAAAETKRTIRRLLDDTVRRQLLEGVTGPTATTDLVAALRAEGVATVTYANGSVHSVADYGDTVARTTTATTRNAGTFTQSRSAGVTYMECFDGPDCGLTTHDDPQKANGLVLPIDDAEGYTIAHPRCARSWAPRPDVRTDDDADEERRYSPEEQATMAADERARASRSLVDGRPAGSLATTGRQPRSPRQPRAPRSGPDAS